MPSDPPIAPATAAPTETPELVKLRLEIEKLRAETATLSKPLRHPTVLGAVIVASITTLASVGNLANQVRSSSRDYQLAQIRTERLQLDAAALERQRAELDKKLAELQEGIFVLDLLAKGKMDQLQIRLSPCPGNFPNPCFFEFQRLPGVSIGGADLTIERKPAPSPAPQPLP